MEIEVKGNSLYRNGFLVTFEDSDEVLLQRNTIEFEGTIHDKYYVVKIDDRLDLIAYRHYKGIVEDSSKYWWVIADANNIPNPLDLSDYIGKEILIPNILNVLLKIQQ